MTGMDALKAQDINSKQALIHIIILSMHSPPRIDRC